MKKKVLAIGHSHLGALEFFLQEGGSIGGFDLDILQLLSKEFDRTIHADADQRLTRVMIERRARSDLVVLAISGNEHQMMGLVNHPRPYDFVLPEEPDLPLQADREIVPAECIEDSLASRMRPDLFKLMSETLAGPLYQLEPPPPVLSHQHIEQYAGVFKDKIAELGINHPIVRYKLWRMSCNLIKSYCKQYCIGFVPVPPEGVGPQGFLHYRALCPDPTHANGWYGALLVAQIGRLLEQG